MTTYTADDNTIVKSRLSILMRWGIAIVIGTAAVITLWTKNVIAVSSLESAVANHEVKFKVLDDQMTSVRIDMVDLKADIRNQTKILQYLANDRRGPMPEAAKIKPSE